MPLLEAQNVAKSFPTPSDPLVVLSDATLELDAGQSVAILGPSGSGKSTLLAILGTLDSPTSGTIRFDGIDPFALDEQQLAEFRQQNMGFVFQDHHLLPQLSVLENVLVPWLASGRPTEENAQAARELIAEVGLADRLTHRPAELSGGERQRVAIARALVREPRLVLADEPTGNLDAETADSVGQLLADLPTKRGAMLIAVTHSLALAKKLDRRVDLGTGQLVATV